MADPVRVGIFGWPVAHSRSPRMHEAAARSLGLDLRYERFAVPPEGLAEAVRREHDAGIDGYNLTVPHKESVLGLLNDVSAAARAIGAVNTVVRSDARYVGHNTDAPGLVRALEEAGVTLKGARVVVLGAGGAARAAVVGLADAGVDDIAVLSRRAEQGAALVRSIGPHVACSVRVGSIGEAPEHFDGATLLIQATSATLGSGPRAEAFAASLPIDALPEDAVVFDMVYEPLETSVLARAIKRGLGTIDGLGMLLHQGAIAFEMWTGLAPPLDVMRDALSSG